jgi:hypothetical protein
MPDARLKEAEMGDLVYSLPPFSSSNAEAYRSLLSSLDSNLDLLQLGCYGISDTTLEEVRDTQMLINVVYTHRVHQHSCIYSVLHIER